MHFGMKPVKPPCFPSQMLVHFFTDPVLCENTCNFIVVYCNFSVVYLLFLIRAALSSFQSVTAEMVPCTAQAVAAAG